MLTCRHANNLYRKFCESMGFIVMMPTMLIIHMESFCSIVTMLTMLTIYMESFNVILIIFVLMMLTTHVECFISCRHIIWNALTVYKIKVGCNLDLFRIWILNYFLILMIMGIQIIFPFSQNHRRRSHSCPCRHQLSLGLWAQISECVKLPTRTRSLW